MGFATAIIAPGLAPPWLLGTVGAAKLGMMGSTLDLLSGPGGKLGQAGEIGMPTKCDPTALPYIGRDRIMPQGAGETTAHYRVRLQTSLIEWQQFSGNAWGVMRQCRNQLLPNMPSMRHVSNTNVWDMFIDGADVSQPPIHANRGDLTWQWDGASGESADAHPAGLPAWWRFWLVIYSIAPTVWCTSLGTWGGTGKKWGDAAVSWGFNNPSAIFQSLAFATTTWKSASSWCRWMIISFDGTLFDPNITNDGTHNPAGTFGRWSRIVNGQYVAARYANARYANVSA